MKILCLVPAWRGAEDGDVVRAVHPSVVSNACVPAAGTVVSVLPCVQEPQTIPYPWHPLHTATKIF